MKYKSSEIGLEIFLDDGFPCRLYEYAIDHYPKEFGGLLIGRYSDDRKTVIIETTVLPKKFKSSKYTFERGVEGLRDELKKLHSQRPSLIYIGEWHTHPDSPAIPSGTDTRALKEIAKHHEVFIDNPILLIMSITKTDFELGFYVLYQNAIYGYKKEE